MRGIWRVRRLLDRIEALGADTEEPALVEETPEEPEEPSRPEPKGLWLPKTQPWAYIVVPKSACTTVGQYAFYADHGYYYHDDIHRLRYGLLKAGVDPTAVADRLDELADEPFTFTFVRDPYARLVSGFLDKVVDLEQAYRPDIRDHVTSDWGVRLGGDEPQTANFKRFMRFVEYQYEKWDEFRAADPEEPDPRESWEKVDIHWLRQSWYLRRGHTHAGPIDFIGAVETMTADLEQLSGHLQPPHRPPLDEMPKFGVGLKREAPLEDYFDDETKAIVDRHFDLDFRVLGYRKKIGAAPMALDGFERAQRWEASRQARSEAAASDTNDED